MLSARGGVVFAAVCTVGAYRTMAQVDDVAESWASMGMGIGTGTGMARGAYYMGCMED